MQARGLLLARLRLRLRTDDLIASRRSPGIPDEVRGEAIKAFVVASSPSDALAAELKPLVRERLASYEVPREIEFVDELPLTTSGKIRRNELRERELSREGPSRPASPFRR